MENPFNIGLWLLLSGLTALFLALFGAYFYSVVQFSQQSVAFPPVFFFNALLLIACTLLFKKCTSAFLEQDFNSYRRIYFIIGILTLFFIAGQIYGWQVLFAQNIPPGHSQVSAYLYLISGLHLLHVIAGIPFLLYYGLRMHRYSKEEHLREIHMADLSNLRHLEYLTRYWLFLDLIWLLMIISFLAQRLFF